MMKSFSHCCTAGRFRPRYNNRKTNRTSKNSIAFFSSAVTNVSHVFSRHGFHYLNVPNVRRIAVSDAFDCTLECLRIQNCVSVNLATSKGADGKLWCEILSSGKYLSPTQFKENRTSHHFSKVMLGLHVSVHCIYPVILCDY